MGALLKTYPLKVKESKLSPNEVRQLYKLIDEHHPLSGISMRMKKFESMIIDEIVILIRRGSFITKAHLEHLVGATDDLFKQIKFNIGADDLTNLDDIAIIRTKFSHNILITENMLVLVLNYLRVRQFLDSINLPYFDIDENRLMNGTVLLGSNAIETSASNTDNNGKSTEIGTTSSRNLSKYSYENMKQLQKIDITEPVSTNQNSHTTNSSSSQSVLYSSAMEMECDNDLLMLIPLDASQKTNQTDDIKQFAANTSIKPTVADVKSTGSIVKKRAAPKSKMKIQYLSGSDSDDSDNNHNNTNGGHGKQTKQPNQAKRTLPQWMTTKKSTSSNGNATNQTNASQKRPFL